MSSIITSNRQVGFDAVKLLERLLAGESVAPQQYAYPPIEVIARQSTDTLAIDHPDVAAALQLIRASACDGLTVGDLLRAVPVARRTLEYQFKRRLGRTVQQEIRRVQLVRVKHLLATTDWAMPEITAATGFSFPSRLSAVFKRSFGTTPSAYRRAVSKTR